MFKIPKELFERIGISADVDAPPLSRSRGYFSEALGRFLKLASARVALGVIVAISLFSLLVPVLVRRSDALMDPYYAKLPPRISVADHSRAVVRGGVSRYLGDVGFTRLLAIGIGSDISYSPIIGTGVYDGRGRTVRVDSYLEVGFVYKSVSAAEYEDILTWESMSGTRVLYPMVEDNGFNRDVSDANFWYKTDSDGYAVVMTEGDYRRAEISESMHIEDNYMRDGEGEPIYALPVGGDGGYRVRVLYYNYYLYKNGMAPDYILGTDSQGYDLALRVAGGIRVSLLLAFSVSLINLVIGALVGAVEGYYGGAVDLAIERVTDVLSGVPFIVVATLFQIYLSDSVGAIPSLLFAFVLTGWLGTANRVRGQFFRYKNSEYVLAAKTMGVSDRRIMWRHIFPNTLGTLITASALIIPGVIFTESMLSFLGIVNLGAEGMTSLGALLSDASGIWMNYPHLMIAPGVIISLLMISFNVIGNCLRDAFNPATKGG